MDTYEYIDPSLDLTGMTAVVTGAAKGIGWAIAKLMAEKGATVAMIDASDLVQERLGELQSISPNSKAFVCDITDKPSIESTIERIKSVFGSLDILINNAGVVRLDAAENLSEEDWDLTLNVNLKGHFLVSQAVGRIMIAQKHGKIVNIASQAGVVALDKHVAYCASKAAIISMTKVLGLEWAKYGIQVNAVSPTVVMTELGKKAWAGEVGENMKKKIPAGRFAMPEEIAAAVLFLASSCANMITGENLIIDGGYTIQ